MASDHGLGDRVLVALRRIMRAVDQHSKRLEQPCGLTGPQILLLKELRDAGELSIGTLARRVNLSQATIAAVVGRLHRREPVPRARADADRRRVAARASRMGEARLHQAPHSSGTLTGGASKPRAAGER